MGTARVKRKEEVDKKIIAKRIVRILEEGNVRGHERESPKQDLASAEDLTILLPYHISD